MEIKKTLGLLAIAGGLLGGVQGVTYAQAGGASGPFADVPADHWAYTAVNTLQQAKIVIGYPDGTYGGRRPMTRYEFAEAIARLLPLIQAPQTTGNFATTDDLAKLRADMEARLTQNQAALDALTRLVNEFQPELQRLGQDVTAINTRLANLEGRVALLEAENQRFHVTGEVNLIAESANSMEKNGFGGPAAPYKPFEDKNGILQGSTVSNRFFEESDVYHDILLHLTGKLSDTATAHVDLDFQNYLTNLGNTALVGDPTTRGGFPTNTHGGGFGLAGSVGGLTNGDFNASVYQAYLDAPVSLGPLGGASVKIGRFGSQFTKWTLKQEDADIYTNLYQTDSGNLLTDGGQLTFKLGAVGVQGFAGKYNTTPFSQAFVGTGITTLNGVVGGQAGAHPLGNFTASGTTVNNAAAITQGAGARFTLGSPEALVIGATVEQFAVGATITNGAGGVTDPNRGTAAALAGVAAPVNSQYNRLSVYGVDLNGGLPFALLGAKKGAITVDGAYTVSAEGANAGFNNVGNKTRYQSHEELVGFNLGKLGVKAGYQFVGPYFSAPGYWGKVGAWSNPTNVKGGVIFGKYPITPKLALNADYEQYRAAYATNDDGTPVSSPINGRDHVNRYQVGLGYGLSSAYAVDLGYERVQWDLRNGNGSLNNSGKPTEDYITIGVGHDFNKNASFKLLYQIVHYNDRNTGFGGAFAPGTPDNNNYAGDIAVGQFSLKF